MPSPERLFESHSPIAAPAIMPRGTSTSGMAATDGAFSNKCVCALLCTPLHAQELRFYRLLVSASTLIEIKPGTVGYLRWEMLLQWLLVSGFMPGRKPAHADVAA